MSINSRQKGKRGELSLCHYLKDEFGWTARRSQQFCGKAGDADIIVEELPNIHFEVKAVEKLNLYSAVEQAKADAKDGHLPVVVWKKNRSTWLLTMEMTNANIWHLYKALKSTPDEKI